MLDRFRRMVSNVMLTSDGETNLILPLVIEESQRVDLTFGDDGLRSLLTGVMIRSGLKVVVMEGCVEVRLDTKVVVGKF